MATKRQRGRIYKRGNSWIVDIRLPNGERHRRSHGPNQMRANRILLGNAPDAQRQLLLPAGVNYSSPSRSRPVLTPARDSFSFDQRLSFSVSVSSWIWTGSLLLPRWAAASFLASSAR